MFLGIRNPWGRVTSLDLRDLPAWQIGLAAASFPGDSIEGDHKTWLVVQFSYVTGGAIFHAPMVGFRLKKTTNEAATIAGIGFPYLDRRSNVDRMREAAKILVNSSIPSSEIEDINQKFAPLVDNYFKALEAWFMPRVERLADPSAGRGELDEWRWAITANRFDPWLHKKGELHAPAPVLLDTPPPGGGGSDMSPPPGEDRGNHPPAPLPAPAKKPQTREERRGAAAKAKTPPTQGKDASVGGMPPLEGTGAASAPITSE